MVIALIVRHLAPSQRGLLHESNDMSGSGSGSGSGLGRSSQLGSSPMAHVSGSISSGSGTDNSERRRNWAKSDNKQIDGGGGGGGGGAQGRSFRNKKNQAKSFVIQKKSKPFRATSALTSAASDFDLIADWWFYFSSVAHDRQFSEEGEHLIPPLLLNLVLFFCITGTLCWLTLATDGRIILPLLKAVGVEGVNRGYVLFFCVLAEDIPQLVLTFLVEDYYDNDMSINNFAVINAMTSLYDLLIKIAEAYDERNDFVESGVWCIDSYPHSRLVTALAPIPHHFLHLSNDSSRTTNHKRSHHCNITPPFLTGSIDGKIHLWHPSPPSSSSSPSISSSPTQQKMIHKFKGHTDAITSIAILGSNVLGYEHIYHPSTVSSNTSTSTSTSISPSTNVFFITGSKDGTIQLWHIHQTQPLRTFVHHSNAHSNIHLHSSPITSLSCMDETGGSLFCSAHRDGVARLWDVLSDHPICSYRGHVDGEAVHCVCSTGDGTTFLTAGEDGLVKLWDTRKVLRLKSLNSSSLSSDEEDDDVNDDNGIVDGHESDKRGKQKKGFGSGWRRSMMMSSRRSSLAYLGTGTGLVPWYDDPTSLIVSPSSLDSPTSKPTERITRNTTETTIPKRKSKSKSKSNTILQEERYCLKTFRGHNGAVLTLSTLEKRLTFLSGSSDHTTRLWCIETGLCLRIFASHGGGITSLSALGDAQTFLTASHDHSVKLWDAENGLCLRTYRGHGSSVIQVENCCNGRTFLTAASMDYCVKLWVLTSVTTSQDESVSFQQQESPSEYDYGHYQHNGLFA